MEAASTTPPSNLCTTSQLRAFTTALVTASKCYGDTTYEWGGMANPTDAEYTEVCKCAYQSSLATPSCSVMKGDYAIPLPEHYDWVMKTECSTKTLAPNVTNAPSMTPSPTATPSSTPVLGLCSVVQISAFSAALQVASSCLSSTSYDWSGNTNPTPSQYAEICKCPTASALTIPSCTVQKGPDTVPLATHYNWVLTNQCPVLFPTGNKSTSSSTVGLIVGIAGGLVVLVAIIGFVVWKRKRAISRAEYQSNTNRMSSPRAFQAVDATPPFINKSSNSRPSAASSAATTLNSTIRPSGNHGTGSSMRSTEAAGKWDDPVIVAVRIPFDAIFVGALISRGGFGEVYRGTYRGETVAIKCLLPDRRKDLAQIDDFLSEVKLMSSLQHDRIVQFIGVAWNSLSDACMVVAYMENGDLRSVLGRWDSGPEQRMNGFDHDKVKIALHVAHALVYLHSLQLIVVHRDLKSKNILLDANFDAKVTDFGISRERADSTMTAGVGSSLWMAPEVMMGQRYDEKADIFSFGVVLSELDTHQLPYSHAKVTESGQKLPEAAILQQVMLGRTSVDFTRQAHPELVELGRECVRLDPTMRPTSAQVLHRVHLVMRQFR